VVRTKAPFDSPSRSLSADAPAPLRPLGLSPRRGLGGLPPSVAGNLPSQRGTDSPLHALYYVGFSFTDGQWRYCQWPFVYSETDYRQRRAFLPPNPRDL